MLYGNSGTSVYGYLTSVYSTHNLAFTNASNGYVGTDTN